MTTSYTFNDTFTIIHARYIASKVATDLLRFRRFYNVPALDWIERFETELIVFLQNNYLDNVIYGLQRGGMWVEALRYHALPGGNLSDDDPGKLRPLDLNGLQFGSYLVPVEKVRIKS